MALSKTLALIILLTGMLCMYRLDDQSGRVARFCNKACSTSISICQWLTATFFSFFTAGRGSPTGALLCKSLMNMCEKTCNLTAYILP
jgi:hypothetical protein